MSTCLVLTLLCVRRSIRRLVLTFEQQVTHLELQQKYVVLLPPAPDEFHVSRKSPVGRLDVLDAFCAESLHREI